MQSAWSDADAAAAVGFYEKKYPGICNEDVALRVYTSRLLGQQAGLVLHGGGNTSVKTTLPDDLGEPTEVACIKGSGWDLASIEPPGLPAVRLAPLRALRGLAELGDEAMVTALRARLLDPSAPNPSVEALLHAFLPHKFIDHSHADAVLAVVDQAGAVELCGEVFGEDYVVVPYVMPGFTLALRAAEAYERAPHCHGLLLLGHGLFSFGATARESYERHILAVTRAEQFILRSKQPLQRTGTADAAVFLRLAPVLRGRLKTARVLHWRPAPEALAFAADPNVRELSGRGPVTPDHVIRTKQRPLVLDAVPEHGLEAVVDAALADYREEYVGYFEKQCAARGVKRTMLDPDPRVVLVPGLGIVAAGVDEAAARVAADLYEHTIAVIRDAEAVGQYQALPDRDIFDMEYWSLEQAKLGKAKPAALAGQVVYITGAASGIGLACARRFAAAGAHLYLVDRDGERLAAAAGNFKNAACEVVDVTRRVEVEASIDRAVLRFGGVDGVISNAGAAFQGQIVDCPEDQLRASLELNLLAHQWVASAAMRVLARQGSGGFLLFNASKAAFNPGEGFGPYAIAKAGLVALMKQYALEAARFGVRANAVNADRVRTGLFPPEVVEARAAARGVTPAAYFSSNLLGREVTGDDVAEAFLSLALAASTTGAVVPVDGGNLAAAPR